MPQEQLMLADLLLRRKELQGKVDQLARIKSHDLFISKVKRQKITDQVDDVFAEVPLLCAKQLTAEHDHYAAKLRKVDAEIQKQNWTTPVAIDPTVMDDYVEPADFMRPELKAAIAKIQAWNDQKATEANQAAQAAQAAAT